MAVPNVDLTSAIDNDFYVVGIGASAGGLEALENLFKAMPSDTGMAFVIVQHLSPDFKSLMVELLARHTDMPIHRVEDGVKVEPNSLYLIPPKQEMIISRGRLLLKEKEDTRSLSLPIDHFFRSLAQDVGPRSIAIVLSGTGSDGSRGLQDVHELGGLVIAQSLESAKFDGMPKSAADTGLVDVVVEPEGIPEVLGRYAAHPLRSELQKLPVDESSMEHIFRLLQERHRLDFNYYKSSTISRRIERRIQLNRHQDMDEYVRRLEEDPREVDLLYKDLLIGVTRFFRDREAFESLRTDLLPKLLLAHDPREEFRVWVAACGTGEEAYSIAILLDQCMREMNRKHSVKIFATDVHQSSLDFAHAGLYPEAALDDVTPERRDRYFLRNESGYQISPEIRQMIVFAPHNLVKDTPFTRLHLITCRNFLIYLRPMAQKKVLSLFHFGLHKDGLLFLGSSESPGELADEFAPVNDRWRVYRKQRDVHLPRDINAVMNLEVAARQANSNFAGSPVARSESDILATYDELLDKFMPAGILINERREVVHMFGGAGRYLMLGDGRITSNLFDLVDGDLKLALTGGLQRVAKSGESVSYSRVRIGSSDGEKMVQLDIAPIGKRDASPKYLALLKESDVAELTVEDSAETLSIDEVSRNRISDLEQELRYTKENLQATIEELETSNEELQATNEELIASNEELQSTNEELHSVNEELYTVNAEHQKKIAELTELTNDMNNLLVSTEVHTLFLDKNLCIRKFTPRIAEVFNLVSHDVGRRIAAFSHSITCHDLVTKIEQVVDTGNKYEERVTDGHGHQFLMRLLPYQAEEATNGAVLTLIDISSLAEAEESVLHERERFERAIAANRDGTWDWPDVTKHEMWWSPSCYRLLGYEPDEFPAVYNEWLHLIHPEDKERVLMTSVPTQDRCFVELHREFEYRMRHKSGEYRWYRHRAIVDHDKSGKPYRMTGSVGDIHARKCAEMQNVEAIRRRDNFLAMLSHELRNPMGAVLNSVDCFRTQVTEESASRSDSSISFTEGFPEGINEEARHALKIIQRQTKHMARLLDDLLDVTRFGQNKIEFRQEMVDLTALVDEIFESVTHEFSSKDQQLNLEIENRPLYVMADPARIKQAQINLLNNASRYTPMKGEIWYELKQIDRDVAVTVRDTGEGIPSSLLDSIFELFVQSESTLDRSSGGMGVGLSLARSIVQAHGGTISAESDGTGQGSTFQIRLPLREKPAQQTAPAPHFSFQDSKLLLVEDNEDARTMLAKTLRLNGFEVAEAGDGEVALALFEEFQPEVAVIDIGLPLMNGYELVRKTKASGLSDGVLLIALTGYGRESDRQEAIEAGFDAHLVKPLDPAQLYRVITEKAPGEFSSQP